MTLAEFPVKRPVMVGMLMLVTLVLGGVSLTFLKADLMPKMTFPNVVVLAEYKGSAPEEIEESVTRILEGAVRTVPGIKKVRSNSQPGISLVIAEFGWGSNLDAAVSDVREKVGYVKRFLPEGVKDPLILKVDMSEFPVLFMNLSGDRDLGDLLRIGKDLVAPRLDRVDGVATTMVMGGRKREIRVEVDRERIVALGLSLEKIVQAVRLANLDISGGTLIEGGVRYSLRGLGQFRGVDEIKDTIVGASDGVPVRLKQVAQVVDGWSDPKGLGRSNGRDGVGVIIRKETDANVLDVSRRVNEALADVRAVLPKGAELTVGFDTADLVRDSIGALSNSAWEGAILVVLILYLFLGRWRPTFIVALSIPLSILVTFICMYFSGQTINMMTLGGILIAIGKLVDDSIVVMENIVRHRNLGKGRLEASVHGVREVFVPVLGATVAAVIVFLPVVFTSGISGQLFRPFGSTYFYAVVGSLAVAYIVIPMLASILLPVNVRFRSVGGWTEAVDVRYRSALHWALNRKKAVAAAVGVVLAATVGMFFVIGKEFIPEFASGMYEGRMKLPTGTPLESTVHVMQGIEERVMALPDRDQFFTIMGESEFSGEDAAIQGTVAGPQNAQFMLRMKKGRERRTTEKALFDIFREAAGNNPAAHIEFNRAGGEFYGSKRPIEVKIYGDDLDVLGLLASEVADSIKGVAGLRQVQSSLEEGNPEIVYSFNRDRASGYGLPTGMAASSVRTAVEGEVASLYREGGEEVDIRVRLLEKDRRSLSDIGEIPIFSPAGFAVPLRDIGRIYHSQGPSVIVRENSKRQATVSGDIMGRSLSRVAEDVGRAVKTVSFPEGYFAELGGQLKDMQEAFLSLLMVGALALLLVYMVLASLYESFIHPLTIMLPIPFAGTGAILALFLTRTSLGVTAFIGLIMLVGIVVMNTVVVVDFILERHRSGIPRREAVIEGAAVRLRPILMTQLATLIGLIPVALGLSEGMEPHIPLGRAVVGGIASSLAISLFLVPILYEVMDDISLRFSGGRGRAS